MAVATHLKTQQVARALGVSVSTIKRWVDTGELGATRTVGKHRLIPVAEAVQFARDRGLPWQAAPAARVAGEERVGRDRRPDAGPAGGGASPCGTRPDPRGSRLVRERRPSGTT